MKETAKYLESIECQLINRENIEIRKHNFQITKPFKNWLNKSICTVHLNTTN